MISTAFIHMWGERAGAVAWDRERGLASFEYDLAFKSRGWDLAPLKMPIQSQNRVFTFPEIQAKTDRSLDAFKGLPGMLADILPDRYGNQLINSWLARNGRAPDSMNPVEQLCFIGTRGMGALEFEPSQYIRESRTFSVELESLVALAAQMLHKRESFSANMERDEERAMMEILKIGTSAGGARPKAIIAFNPGTGEVRSGQTRVPQGFEHWLIKLDGVSDAQFGNSSGYGRVEMAYYLMARDCGIDIMVSRLLEENGRAHFMTRRFDREGADIKHHVQTFCAMQHFDFNEVSSFSYEQLFQTMRQIGLPYPQADQLFRRMVFNVISRNCDDHTKNFTFRLKKGEKWELAPAYDLCHAYRPGSEWVSRQSLSVNGKRQHITREDFLSVAKAMNIKNARDIIKEVSQVIVSWNKYAERVEVNPKLANAISQTLSTRL